MEELGDFFDLVSKMLNFIFFQSNKRKKGTIKSRPTVVKGQKPSQ